MNLVKALLIELTIARKAITLATIAGILRFFFDDGTGVEVPWSSESDVTFVFLFLQCS